MKLYTFANAAYEPLRQRFTSSLQDDYEIVVVDATFKKCEGVHSQDTWRCKTQMIIDAIKENMGNRIIVCDIDIQFFRPTLPLIESCPDVDFLCQFEPADTLCIGFMVIKCNDRTVDFFTEVLRMVNAGEWDQKIINEMLKTDKRLEWAWLPEEIWGWNPHQQPPEKVACHHATFALTLEDKLQQMDKILQVVQSRTT